MRMSRRLTSTSTWVTSSISLGEPPRAEASRNIRSVRPVSPNPPKDTDGRREESGRGVRELQGK